MSSNLELKQIQLEIEQRQRNPNKEEKETLWLESLARANALWLAIEHRYESTEKDETVGYETRKADHTENSKDSNKTQEEQEDYYENLLTSLRAELREAKVTLASSTLKGDRATRLFREASKKQGAAVIRHPAIGVKWVGYMDDGPWITFFERKRKADPSMTGELLSNALTEWEHILQDPEFRSFKLIQIGEDKRKVGSPRERQPK
ncbi:unnamed protein product [Calypogeia fissa]